MPTEMVLADGFEADLKKIITRNPQFAADILAALVELKNGTCPAGRVEKLRGVPEPIYELRIRVERNILRVLFSKEPPSDELLVCVVVFHKKDQKIDKQKINNAVVRIRAWRSARDAP